MRILFGIFLIIFSQNLFKKCLPSSFSITSIFFDFGYIDTKLIRGHKTQKDVTSLRQRQDLRKRETAMRQEETPDSLEIDNYGAANKIIIDLEKMIMTTSAAHHDAPSKHHETLRTRTAPPTTKTVGGQLS